MSSTGQPPARRSDTGALPAAAAAERDRRARRLRRRVLSMHLGIIVAGVAVTVAPLLDERLHTALFAPQVRPVIEVAGACIVLFAALILASTHEGGKDDTTVAEKLLAREAAAHDSLGTADTVTGL